jgi:hypothetical protein
MRHLLAAALIALLFAAGPAAADDFAFEFDWGDIALCGGGVPDIVPNPRFTLHNVPAGTVFIQFEMVDLTDQKMVHGGGTVPYHGQTVIEPGAFTYPGPCPTEGFHMYQWTARARASDNPMATPLAIATAEVEYP